MGATILDHENHSYTHDGASVPLSVSDVLRLSGICQPYPEDPRVMALVRHAGELGSCVHDWCDYVDAGETDVERLRDTDVLPYVLAYRRFTEECEPEWEAIEQSVCDPVLGVAGTLDRIGTMKRGNGRRPVIVDIKSPKAAAKYWQVQLSAYQYLSSPGRLDCSLFVVHLASDGSYKVRPYESDIETFLCAVKVAQWRVKNGVKIR